MNATLSIHSLNKSFKHGKVQANRNISARFSAGKITVLAGHNGAGKTTLLNQIMGLSKPDSGTITFAGHSFVHEPQAARNLIAMMPQLHAPLVGVSLRQAVEAIVRIREGHNAATKAGIRAILATLKITEWANTPGEKLSGGLRRLAAFAMTVAAPPPILLLDEPTNDVDPVRRKLMWQVLRQLAAQGHIIIVVTHNLLEAAQYADHYLVLDHGQVIQDGPVGIGTGAEQKQCVLTLSTRTPLAPSTYPAHLQVTDNQMGEYTFLLAANQVVPAVRWLQALVETASVENFALTPNNLNARYGGLTDG